ncbi:MAG: acyltransferase [Dechloromonas sp.]|nr:MAG: acyltransferase [Dechloromonas sp.]
MIFQTPSHLLTAGNQPLQFVIALRAVAATLIVWHHFAIYPPLAKWAAPLWGGVLDWLAQHARTTQVFFVVGGYVMARSMSGRSWNLRGFRSFFVQRYFRLGLPYVGAIAMILPIYVLARDWLPEQVVGQPPTLPQLLAHLLFLQGVLGYEQLSAGLWFVCINFQLGLVYAAILVLRDTIGQGRVDFVGLLGWPLLAFSLFHFNLDDGWDSWWFYFFPYFFLGIVIDRSVRGEAYKLEFWLCLLLFVGAMTFEWRWRLLSALVVGLLLFVVERRGWGALWPQVPLISWLGRISFSLFLVHFPVLVLVGTLWTRFDWTSPAAGVTGLLVAYGLSLLVAELFHRFVEQPAAWIYRREPRTDAEDGTLRPTAKEDFQAPVVNAR